MMFKVLHRSLMRKSVVPKEREHWFKQVVGWQMAPHIASNEAQGLEKLALSKDDANEVLEICKTDAKTLDETFFGGKSIIEKALQDARKKAGNTPQSLNPADHLSEGEIGMIRGWADFLAQIAAADIEHFAWAIQPPGVRTPRPPQRAAHGRMNAQSKAAKKKVDKKPA